MVEPAYRHALHGIDSEAKKRASTPLKFAGKVLDHKIIDQMTPSLGVTVGCQDVVHSVDDLDNGQI